ncbi:MAG TPA: glycosyltransferase [Gallionellaceae bacterium]
MKVLIAYHRFPPIAEDLKKAFVSLGVEAEIFYTTDYEHWFYRRIIRKVNRHARNLRLIKKGGDLFKRHPLNLVNYVGSNFEQALARYQPDAVLVIHGLPFGESFISGLSLPKIGWHLEPRDDLPYLIENAKPYDIYNSYSQKDVDQLIGAGYDCRYLTHAVDPEKFHTEAGTDRIYDLAFVGNWSPWRDEVVKAALEVTDKVAVYGGYWLKKSAIPRSVLKPAYKGKEIIGAELNRLFNQSRIVLNASRTPKSYGLNMRFFEVPAAGSLMLTDEVPELEKHFVPQKHLVVYKDAAELKQRLRELLNNPASLDAIRLAGQSLVVQQHNYRRMVEYFLGQFREIAAKKSASA